jgi:hypothetical protein
LPFDFEYADRVHIDSFELKCVFGNFLLRYSILEEILEVFFVVLNIVIVMMGCIFAKNILWISCVDLSLVEENRLFNNLMILSIGRMVINVLGLVNSHHIFYIIFI